MALEKVDLQHVKLADISVSKTNDLWREPFELEQAALQELIDSVRDKGVLQPILLRTNGKPGKYELVCGERRYRASLAVQIQHKDRDTIPSYIRTLNDDEALDAQFIENNERENPNPVKQARTFKLMIEANKATPAGIAKRLGVSIDYVNERLRLNQLIKPILDLVRTGDIPLKAGLKMARIPEKQQQDALDDCTDTMNLKSNVRKTVFAGLDRLQDWMDDNLWTDLTKADFDKEYPKLNPTMGACSTCPHRSKNTGGLFDDITLEDKCLLASCYRTKQVSTYKLLKERLEKKYPGKTVVFKERGGNVDAKDLFKKQLGEIKSHMGGQKITEAEMLKNKKAEVAILIGIPHYSNDDLKKEYIFTKPQETYRSGDSSSSSSTPAKVLTAEQKKSAAQKEKDNERRNRMQRVTEDRLVAQAIAGRLTSSLQAAMIRFSIEEILDMGDTEDIRPVFVALGIDWVEDFKEKRVTVKAKDADLELMNDRDSDWSIGVDDVVDSINKLPFDKLMQVFTCLQFACNYSMKSNMVKAFKIDSKAIKTKAISETSSWWSAVVKKRAQEAEYKAHPELRKVDEFIGLPLVKKGLKSLLKKGGKK